ncbi:ATP-dependent DNA helicase PIF1-like, partial [Aphis craccivora]
MLRLSKIPPTSIINDLYLPSIPDVILSLNSFVKILIQRAKAFQVVVKMESISDKQQSRCNMIEKVVGRTNSDLFEKENNIDFKEVSKQNEGIELNIEEQTNLHAFLTQRDINETFYEQFTIHALNEPRKNAKASELYQMLKINENPIDNRDKELDLKCFPAIYPIGQNGRLRNTNQYWLNPRSDIELMITWYGPVTLFLTLSPAVYNWKQLESFLRKVNNDTENGKSISDLIAHDPVSSSRMIDNEFKAMLEFISADNGPLGKVKHYAWRRDYQSRGFQHFHIIIWIDEASIIEKNSNEEVVSFIAKTITCHFPDKRKFPTLHERKTTAGKTTACRFGFPRLVTKEIILRDVATSIVGRRNFKSKSRFYDLPRDSREVYINVYNLAVLMAWNGNMDLQYIGEKSWALSSYVTKYQTKPEKKPIRLKHLTNRECGSLEASDTLLGIPLFGTDPCTTIKWLGVSIFRNRRLKSKEEIELLDAESNNIFFPSIIHTHYPNRPIELEHLSLFDYARNYDIVKLTPKNDQVKYYAYPGYGFIKKRSRSYLIKHPKYNANLEPEKYFHCLLMLFKPWRVESELLGNNNTYIESFKSCRNSIDAALDYHEQLEYLRKSKDDMNELLKNLTMKMTPNSENDELQQAEIIQDAMSELEIGTIYLEQTNDLINNLNSDQKKIFNFIKKELQLENEKCMRHFVSGVVAITAPTGISAFNIEGMTIHRLLQLPVEHGHTLSYIPLSNNVLQTIRHHMKDVLLLIIDEVTDCNDGWFGRLHILVFGELLQLPPVNEGSLFNQIDLKLFTIYTNTLGTVNLWQNLFTYDELTQNMRQNMIPFMQSYMKSKATKKLSCLDNDSSRMAGLEKRINIKVGCKIILLRNIDVTNGLVNGAIGIVVGIQNEFDLKPEKVVVQFGTQIHNIERVT